MLEECTIPRQKIKTISGEGYSPLPRPLPYWGGDTPSPNPGPLGACGASTLVPSALDMCSPFENPGSAPGL